MIPAMGEPRRADLSDRQTAPSDRRPAGMATGPGHVVVYGNPAFRRAFGAAAIGLPARETMLDLTPEGFALLDAVYATGRPLARGIQRRDGAGRQTANPRREFGTDEVYGVAFHLRARSDVPVVAAPD